MAMFSKKPDENSSEEITSDETIIGPSVKLEGEIKSNGNLKIEGEVVGRVDVKGELFVGENAKIDADIVAGGAKVLGRITGNIVVADELELGEKSELLGDVTTKLLSVSRGAKLKGQCNMGEDLSQIKPPKK